jgi:hypothetical protein
MKTTTSDNLRLRHKWLEQVVARGISPSKSQILGIATMRDFCRLEMPSWFPPVALNTLKHAASRCESTNGFEHLWAEIKDLRTRAFLLYTPKANTATNTPLPSFKDQARIALLEAHISTIAYFDIYNFLVLLREQNSDDAPGILSSIKLKIDASKAKYQSFLLHDTTLQTNTLHIIKGGKERE